MKTLTLLRHAKSSWDDSVVRDFDRPLNAKGERAAIAMGRHARSLGLAFDCVIASPARRVEETVEQFAIGYGRAVDPRWDRRLYLASAATLLDLVHELDEGFGRVLLIGHNPGLEDLVLALVPPAPLDTLRHAVESKFPTATLAELHCDARWRDLDGGGAELARFVRPRDLDATLGPDQD